jgi:hypothetical protein
MSAHEHAAQAPKGRRTHQESLASLLNLGARIRLQTEQGFLSALRTRYDLFRRCSSSPEMVPGILPQCGVSSASYVCKYSSRSLGNVARYARQMRTRVRTYLDQRGKSHNSRKRLQPMPKAPEGLSRIRGISFAE